MALNSLLLLDNIVCLSQLSLLGLHNDEENGWHSEYCKTRVQTICTGMKDNDHSTF